MKSTNKVDGQTNYVMTTCLYTETNFNYLNYYYQNMLDETNDESYMYKS